MSKRLLKELKDYKTERKELLKNGLLLLAPTDDLDLSQWKLLISLDKYLGIVWLLDINIPDEYPIKAPVVRFHKSISKPQLLNWFDTQPLQGSKFIYEIVPPHVNINFNDGDICLDLIRGDKKMWTPLWTLLKMCLTIVVLLEQGGEPDNPFNIDLLNLTKTDPKALDGLINYYVNKYLVQI